MQVKAAARDAAKVRADALIVSLFQGVKKPDGVTGAVDRALDGAISKLIAAGEIKGTLGQITTIHVFGQIPASRVVVAGLGRKRDFGPDEARRVTAVAMRAMRGVGAKRVATALHGAGEGADSTPKPRRRRPPRARSSASTSTSAPGSRRRRKA